MGRSVQCDSSIQQYAESCVQRRVAAEVGTLVGRCAPGKDLVLQALRAPEGDAAVPVTLAAGSAAKKGGKGGKAGSSAAAGGLLLDEELVVEHAALLEQLLPGGLDVVGFYVLCPAATFASAAGLLTAMVTHAGRELSGHLPSLLVLHLDSVSGALSLREAAPGAGASLRPSEVKMAGLLDQMVQLQSRYELSLQLPVTTGTQEVQAAFQAAADGAAAGTCGVLGLVGGQLASANWQLAGLDGDGGSSSGSGPIPVELLLQPSSSLAFCTVGGSKAGSRLQRGRTEVATMGLVGLQGCLDCRACVHCREAAVAAVDAVRADIKRSLQARMDALLDAAEQQQEVAAAEAEQQQRQRGAVGRGDMAPLPPEHPLFAAAADSSKPLVVALPRRAFVAAAAAGGVPYCDYLFEGESTQALLGRLQLLLPMPGLATAAVECLEQAAALGFRGPEPHRGSTSSSGGGSRAGTLPCTLLAAGSVAVAVLALAVGYMILGGSGH